jgi:hypothetical protein
MAETNPINISNLKESRINNILHTPAKRVGRSTHNMLARRNVEDGRLSNLPLYCQ